MIDWESSARTSPDITSLPWRRPNLCGLGMSRFTWSVIRALPIIFFFLLARTPTQSTVRRDLPSGNWSTRRGDLWGTASTMPWELVSG